MSNAFKISNLTDAQKEWLKKEAKLQGTSMAVIVKQLINIAMKVNKHE